MAMETFEDGYQRVVGAPAPPIDNPQLAKYWNLPVSTLCTLQPPISVQPEMQERHRLYQYLLMAIGWFYWCGYKDGRFGTYPWNDPPTNADPVWLSSDYRGHNIVALAADAQGHVVDFDLNHNKLFNSSAEHAEARLVRRLYGLASVGGAWAPTDPASSSGSTLLGFTVYTSLESCAQCSGIMALAGVSQVVFLQQDPGEYLIGRILHNLTPPSFQAPLPISGYDIALDEFTTLNTDFTTFTQKVASTPFWISADGSQKDTSPSITSFLCTGQARGVYRSGGEKLPDALDYPNYTPPGISGALSNGQVQSACEDFLDYAVKVALRGTPHTI
jgi:tRNA(Arg) A34 adenosine deaminase TadA